MEKQDYYSSLREEANNIKFSKIANLGHHVATPFMMKLNANFSKEKEALAYGESRERIVRGRENLPNNAALYLANHSNLSDVSNLYNAINRQFYILGDANQMNDKTTNLFNSLIGCVYVKRFLNPDEEELAKKGEYEIPYNLTGKYAKLSMINKLMNKQNCVIFPEGTWNTNYDELMMPTKWGAVDIAGAARVPIVPVNIEYLYDENKTITTILKPIMVSENDDKSVINEQISKAIADNRIAVREEFYGKGNAIGHYSKEEWDEILIKNQMAYPYAPIFDELKCVYIRNEEENKLRRAQYEHLDELQKEAQKRVLKLENRIVKK